MSFVVNYTPQNKTGYMRIVGVPPTLKFVVDDAVWFTLSASNNTERLNRPCYLEVVHIDGVCLTDFPVKKAKIEWKDNNLDQPSFNLIFDDSLIVMVKCVTLLPDVTSAIVQIATVYCDDSTCTEYQYFKVPCEYIGDGQ